MKESDRFSAPELNNLLNKAKKFDLWANRALSFEMLGCATVAGISVAIKHWDLALLSTVFFSISKGIHFALDEVSQQRIQYFENLKSTPEKEETNYGM